MKIGGRIALFAAGLCVMTGTVCAELYLAHRNHVPGKYGRNLEFRVSAMTTEYFDQFNRAPEGPDVFSVSQAHEIAESGRAPAGFTWLPVSRFDLVVTGGIEPRGITRVTNGQEFLLVADRPDMVLTHSADKPCMGCQVCRDDFHIHIWSGGKASQIDLDDTGGDLLRQFTEKYVRHSIAVAWTGK